MAAIFFRKSIVNVAKGSSESFSYRGNASTSTFRKKISLFTRLTTKLRYGFVSLVNNKTFSSLAPNSENLMNNQLLEAFMDPITHEKKSRPVSENVKKKIRLCAR
ncbi:hypothetical protein HanIR_Chr11g0512211 [Helianthus annuus]|nr:hypothetical protein HanIR_Chr11g0512211 [Helianthus annuus]